MLSSVFVRKFRQGSNKKNPNLFFLSVDFGMQYYKRSNVWLGNFEPIQKVSRRQLDLEVPSEPKLSHLHTDVVLTYDINLWRIK